MEQLGNPANSLAWGWRRQSLIVCDRLKREFRLTKSTDYQRVRQNGKSYAHPLVVLIAQPNATSRTRVAVTANRSVGNAVQRNSARRITREIMRKVFPQVAPGWDIIVIARQSISGATYQEIEGAIRQLLTKAGLLI